MPAVADATGSYSFFERHGPGFVEPFTRSTTCVSSSSSTATAEL